jgi:predicted negative regulator of RcsB-dependent stress response
MMSVMALILFLALLGVLAVIGFFVWSKYQAHQKRRSK